jgi:hypothetical protein
MIRKIVTSLIAVLFVLTLFTPVFAEDGETKTEVDETKAFCESGKTHPGIAKLSIIFDLDENEVKEYYCMGYGLGAIRLALRAAALDSDVDVLDFLNELEQELEELEEEDEPEEENEFEDEDEFEDEGEFEGKETDDKKESVYCEYLDTMEHPTGMRYYYMYKDSMGVTYDEIMGWFCEENLGFGEIKHLLNTALNSEFSIEEILEMRGDMGWGEIWQEAGFIGQGKPKVHPVFGENWPNDKGPQAKGKPVDAGPPVGKGKPGK